MLRSYRFPVCSLLNDSPLPSPDAAKDEGADLTPRPFVPNQPDMAQALEQFLRTQIELDRDWIRIQREREVDQAKLDVIRRRTE